MLKDFQSKSNKVYKVLLKDSLHFEEKEFSLIAFRDKAIVLFITNAVSNVILRSERNRQKPESI